MFCTVANVWVSFFPAAILFVSAFILSLEMQCYIDRNMYISYWKRAIMNEEIFRNNRSSPIKRLFHLCLCLINRTLEYLANSFCSPNRLTSDKISNSSLICCCRCAMALNRSAKSLWSSGAIRFDTPDSAQNLMRNGPFSNDYSFNVNGNNIWPMRICWNICSVTVCNSVQISSKCYVT